MKIYKISEKYEKFSKPDPNWFGEGAIFGYTRTDNFKSYSVKLSPDVAATWNQKNGITHEEVFGLMQMEVSAFTWIYDIGRHLMTGYGWDEEVPIDIKESAMEEVFKRI